MLSSFGPFPGMPPSAAPPPTNTATHRTTRSRPTTTTAATSAAAAPTMEVPHLLSTLAAYLQRLQSPDFNPAPMHVTSLALGA